MRLASMRSISAGGRTRRLRSSMYMTSWADARRRRELLTMPMSLNASDRRLGQTHSSLSLNRLSGGVSRSIPAGHHRPGVLGLTSTSSDSRTLRHRPGCGPLLGGRPDDVHEPAPAPHHRSSPPDRQPAVVGLVVGVIFRQRDDLVLLLMMAKQTTRSRSPVARPSTTG